MNRPLSSALFTTLSQIFKEHGLKIYANPERANASPLYAHLSLQIASDPTILELVIDADRATQVSNLLFGAVHFLLLSGIEDPLVAFYPDLVEEPQPIADSYPVFRAFCLKHAEAIRQLVTSRRVQTNEVGRCTIFPPTFGLIVERVGPKPLALLEIGTSAGLHLLWDHFRYDYGIGVQIGDNTSPVLISCELRGPQRPVIPVKFPVVSFRLGIELHPIDTEDREATRWLRALIWPEHHDRAELLAQALRVKQQYPISILGGSAPDLLPAALSQVPSDAALCIFHSYTLNQMPQPTRDTTLQEIERYAATHQLFRISQEWYAGQAQPQVELYSYDTGHVQTELLARCESHGRWVQWL
jgi:hypothetical protein